MTEEVLHLVQVIEVMGGKQETDLRAEGIPKEADLEISRRLLVRQEGLKEVPLDSQDSERITPRGHRITLVVPVVSIEHSRGLPLTIEVVVDGSLKAPQVASVSISEGVEDTGHTQVLPTDTTGDVVPLAVTNASPAMVRIGLEIIEPLLDGHSMAGEERLRVRRQRGIGGSRSVGHCRSRSTSHCRST